MPLNILSEKDFLGRSNQLQFLYRLALDARTDSAVSAFLSGQRGAGKTEILKQLFNLLLWQQDNIAPFYYSVNNAMISASDFSDDYMGRFVCQRLAFDKKDSLLINAVGLSIGDLLHLTEKLDTSWAIDILNSYLQAKTNKNPAHIILSALSAPHRSYLSTGVPVVVMIDNFQRVKGLYKSGREDNKNLWLLFEEVIKSRHTPHIITGLHVEIQKMLFQETSFGKSLEIINLPPLDKDASLKILSSMCEAHNIPFEKEPWLGIVDLFNGIPLNIRHFVHAVSQEVKTPSKDDLCRVYFHEITKGKFYTYWSSILKNCMPQLSLRKASLEFLYHLYEKGPTAISPNLAGILAISRDELYEIAGFFQTAGIIETDFTAFKLVEDRILTDVIICLYYREILKEPLNKIEDMIIHEKLQRIKPSEKPSFELTMPAAPVSELIAVKILEQIGENYNIPPDVIGQLQAALIDLFTNVISHNAIPGENFHLKFNSENEAFTITVQTPQKEFISFSSEEPYKEGAGLELIKRFTDDIRFEKIKNGTNIVLRRNLKLGNQESFL
ncbi:MAG: hypothetical protein HZC11_00385 [Nitrospirae bacterium]|nr:hypothetical protein [Nitrospirota bacterium]